MTKLNPEDDIKLGKNLSRAEALLIFEWLSNASEEEKLQGIVNDEATYWAFEMLLGCLEKTLVEPFRDDYLDQIKNAKEHLLKKHADTEE